MSWLSKAVGNASNEVARIPKNVEHYLQNPLEIPRAIQNQMVPRKPSPRRPATIGGCRVDGRTGAQLGTREPFVLPMRLQLAAGAQSATAALGDFFTTAASNILTTNNLIPGDFVAEEAKLYVGVLANVTLSTENTAALASAYLIEKMNGREISRFSVTDMGMVVNHFGTLGTAFGQSSTYEIPSQGVDFDMAYDPTIQYGMELWIPRTFTSVNIIDVTLVLTGTRA